MEIIANAIQDVAVNNNILFTDTVVKGNRWISHRNGSGLITLKGLRTCGCECQKARYLVTFSGNISAPAITGTTEELSVAISIDGEPVQATRMRVTIGTPGNYYNVAASTYIEAPSNCCVKVSVMNTSARLINVQNANLTAVRVA